MQKGLLKEHANFISVTHRLIDCVVGMFSGYLVSLFYPGYAQTNNYYLYALLISSLLIAVVFPRYSLYKMWRGMSIFEEIKYLSTAWVTVVLILLMLTVVTKTSEHFSRIWMGSWAVFGLLMLILSRLITRYTLRKMRENGLNSRRILVVGGGLAAIELMEKLKANKWAGFNVLGFVSDRDKNNNGQFKCLGKEQDIILLLNELSVDQVWIVVPLKEEVRLKVALDRLKYSTVDIRYVLDIFSLNLFNHSMTEVAGYPVINLSATPMEGFNRVFKNLEDYSIAFILIVVLFPLWVFIVIILKSSSGEPILFKQKRHGWDGREINVYKFRTMRSHDEPGDTITQAMEGDKRVTKIGRLLRQTSLDELPQLFNVLQGRMSLVGPRPHAVEHNDQYKKNINKYMLRHKVKPGITGWAQINGYRGRTDTIDKMQKRIEYDIFYIENWSIWFDIKILVLTIFKGFMHKNAY